MKIVTGWARVVAATGALIWALTGAAAAQDGRWYRGESANFVVYGPGDRQVRAAAELLERFDDTLRFLLHVEAPDAEAKLDIYLVSGLDQLRDVQPRLGENVAGFYSPNTEYVAAFAIYDNSRGLSRRQILFHEYAHHFMLHYAPRAYPRWYVEGWAEWVSTTEFREGVALVGRPSDDRSYTIDDRRFMAMSQFLAPERVARRDENFDERFYAQSWFAAMYIGNRPERSAGLNRYVNALSRGEDPIEAFQPAFGITPDQFATEMRALITGTVRVGQVPLPAGTPVVAVTRMPRSADSLLLQTARLRFDNVQEDERQAYATAIETEAARFRGDPFAERAAARAALLREDTAAARAHLEPLLTNDTDVEARFLMGKTYLKDAEAATDPAVQDEAIREARRHFVRAFRTDPNNFPTLFNYATTFLRADGPMDAQNMNVLGRSLELAPQSATIRMTLADELIRAGQYDDAVLTLRPLMYAPHGGNYADRARVMTEAARRHEAPPPWNPDQPDDSGD